MKVAVYREEEPGELRVAATPDSVRHLADQGLDVVVEAGAGDTAGYSDAAFAASGAEVATSIDPQAIDVLAHVRPLAAEFIGRLRPGTITIGFGSPAGQLEAVAAFRDARVTAFAMELVPRISRAQSMDALTSQALVSGYRCALEAAMRLPRFFPLYMTAAGTIPPAKVLVLGAGVAGLQAIATARRLGARVSAYDVRVASADEVRSMGGTFVDLGLDAIDGAGGYARELAEDRARLQQERLAPFVADADVVITTAAIPGRPAPRLVSAGMLWGMRNGSVVVDLAAESGGNVEGSIPGEEVRVAVADGQIVLIGMKDVPSTMASDASRLLARNISNLIALMTVEGAVVPDFDDEVVRGTCLTHEGAILHQPSRDALEGTR